MDLAYDVSICGVLAFFENRFLTSVNLEWLIIFVLSIQISPLS